MSLPALTTPLRPSRSTSSFLAPTISLSSISRTSSVNSLPQSPMTMSSNDLKRSVSTLSSGSTVSATPSVPALSLNTFSETWPANSYLNVRDGEILTNTLILKSDRVPDAYSSDLSLPVYISGAPNFRQILDFPVFGVGQPSSYGIQSILNWMKHGHTMWVNLREEPVVYLNNRPYVLRDLKHPFRNMRDFAGISADRVEQIEQQIKEDLLKEASNYNGNFLVHREVPGSRMIPCFEAVSEATVQTSRDIYEALKKSLYGRAYSVDYIRLPVNAEGMMNIQDMDSLVKRIRTFTQNQSDAHVASNIVFNCQMGRSRTTIGTIMSCLLLRSAGLIDQSVAFATSKFIDMPAIQKLMRFLPRGKESKSNVDLAVEWCGSVTHIHNELEQAKLDIETARTEDKRKLLLPHATQCLERYFYLLCFSEYITEVPWQQNGSESFSDWMRSRPQIAKIASEFVRGERAFDPIDHLKSMSYASHYDPQIAVALSQRTGNVISEQSILKSSPLLSLSRSTVDGAPNFRYIDQMPIFCTAQPTVTGIKNVLSLVHASGASKQTALWINLCEEACVYIADVACTLRDAFHPFRALSEFRVAAMPRDRLEELEERLSVEAREELSRCQGQILVHQEQERYQLSPVWVCAQQKDIVSEAAVYSQLTQSGFDVEHYRIPLVVDAVPDTIALDQIFFALTKRDVLLNPARPIVFQCYMGGRRSAVGMAIALLVRMNFNRLYGNVLEGPSDNIHVIERNTVSASSPSANEDFLINESVSLSPLLTATDDKTSTDLVNDTCSTVINIGPNDVQQPPSMQLEHTHSFGGQNESTVPDTNSNRHSNYRAIISLCRVLKQGRVIKEEVDSALETCGGFAYIQDYITQKRTLWETERDHQRQAMLLQDMTSSLQSYCVLIIFNAFLHEYFHTANCAPRFVSFTDWMDNRPELHTQLENIAKSPEDSLKLDSATSSRDDNAEVYVQRRGNVLLSTSIMKSDYFPGCQNPSLELRVDGAPNVRFMPTKLHIGGTAMPNVNGVQSVLAMLPSVAEQALKSVRWVCLREEPVLYICNSPYVLRDLDKPYANFEYTGINTSRVEAIERQLKRDVLVESEKYNGRLLVHDETANGSLVGIWVDVTADNVLTTKEMYLQAMSSFASKQLKLSLTDGPVDNHAINSTLSSMKIVYSRVPITDEQVPTVEVFDWFVRYIESAIDGQFLLFNCQMGRGRTTTAMIISALITAQRPGSTVSFDQIEEMLRNSHIGPGHAPTIPSVASASSKPAEPNQPQVVYTAEQVQQFMRGDYPVIARLLRLIENGPLCKSQVDRVIEASSHMQNLREAIWATKVRADRSMSAHQREEGWARARAYLVRYFYLICFNAFLTACVSKGSLKSFTEFMHENPALTNCLDDVVVG